MKVTGSDSYCYLQKILSFQSHPIPNFDYPFICTLLRVMCQESTTPNQRQCFSYKYKWSVPFRLMGKYWLLQRNERDIKHIFCVLYFGRGNRNTYQGSREHFAISQPAPVTLATLARPVFRGLPCVRVPGCFCVCPQTCQTTPAPRTAWGETRIEKVQEAFLCKHCTFPPSHH